MCGIAGAYYFNPSDINEVLFIRSLDLLNHRGPDASESLFRQKLCLGHKRLSIIDLDSKSNQPFTEDNEEYALIFNGEIYNYQELRSQLELLGIEFRTKGDTEVLYQMLKKFGKDALLKLEGCFALAFANLNNGSVLLARDPMGINPLYYSVNEKNISFASEIRFLNSLNDPSVLNKNALSSFFKLSYIPAPSSIYKDTFKLEPGCFATIKNGKFNSGRYYHIPRKEMKFTSFSHACKELRKVLQNAVNKRLLADVPLGGFLSGGIDSSIISALACKSIKDFKTFSIGFENAAYFDETRYAEEVAEKIGSNHKTFKLTTQDLHNSAKEMLQHFDEPFADSSAIAVNLLSKEVKKHVTVALSGDGADELFSGYNKHSAELLLLKNPLLRTLLKYIPDFSSLFGSSKSSFAGNKMRQISKMKQGALLDSKARYGKWLSQLDLDLDELLIEDAPFKLDLFQTDIQNINDILYLDSRIVLPNDMLYKVDISSMYNSLEVRTPFLDKEVVKFAFSLPQEFKINGKRRKIILREAFKNELPVSVFTRKKKGFEIPMRQIVLESLKFETDKLLNKDLISKQGLFSIEYIARILNKLQSNQPGNSANQIWSLLVFQSFWKNNLENMHE